MKKVTVAFTIYRKPVSINASYGLSIQTKVSKKGFSYTPIMASKEHKEMKFHVSVQARAAMNKLDLNKTKCPCSVTYKYYFKNRIRRDVTNYEKPIQDGLSKVVFEDDSQIGDNTDPMFFEFQFECKQMRFVDKNNPRIEIEIFWYEPITIGEPQNV